VRLLERGAARVDRAVLVLLSWEGDRHDLAMEAALLHSDPFAIMERIALERPESQALAETWEQQPGMCLTLSSGGPICPGCTLLL
jgi:hypothetical protein